MSRRALLVLLAVIGIGVGLYLWQAVFVSEEDRVRDTLFDIVDSFNDLRAGSLCSGLAERIRVRGRTWKRDDEIKPRLVAAFFRDRQRGGPRFRVEILEPSLTLSIYESDHQLRADVTLSYHFAERVGKAWGEAEERHVELLMVKHDVDGWQVVEVVAGDRLPYHP